MKNRKFNTIFLIVALLISAACGRVASQSQNTTNVERMQSDGDVKDETAVKTNSKYRLSIISRLVENEAGKKYYEYKIRDDRTQRELPVNFYEYALRVPAEKPVEVWSPNEEYLILNCGGFCVYKSSETAKTLGKSKSFQAEKYQGKTVVVTDKGNSEYEQEFVKWDENESFILRATRVKYDGTARNEKFAPEEYRYDIARRKLICLSSVCGFTKDKNGRLKKIEKIEIY